MLFSQLYKDFKEFSSKNSLVLSLFFILILIYPLFTLSVKHWSSGIYSLLCLLSIGFLFKKNNFIYPREVKIYAWIVFLFFVSILISSTLNDWTFNSYKRLGLEFKILFFIPFFLLMAQYTAIRKWYVYSIPFAGIILGTHGILEVLVFNEPYANSSYGKIITGDIAGLLVGLSGIIWIYTDDKLLKKICMIAIILASITCVLSVSRNGWLVLFTNVVFLILITIKRNKKYAILLVLFSLIAVLIGSAIIKPKRNLDAAVNQFESYFDKSKRSNVDLRRSSIGYRLGQWEAVLVAFPEKPIFGFGPGNSSLVINDYIAKGLANPDLYHKDAAYNMGHVHNQYLDTLLVQGLFGLVLLLLMLFYPAWIFIKYYRNNEVYANLGLILIISYSISSLTEIPFISDNFTSNYFMYLSVFFLNTIDKVPLPERAVN